MIYTQTDGLPMGSSISGILAEIFIHNIEQKHILNNNKYTNKNIYWYRYVAVSYTHLDVYKRQILRHSNDERKVDIPVV